MGSSIRSTSWHAQRLRRQDGLILNKRPLLLGGTNNPVSLSWAGVSVARNTVYASVGILGLPQGYIVAYKPGDVGDLVGDIGETLGGLGGGGGGGGGGTGASGGVDAPIAGPGATSSGYATPVASTNVDGSIQFANLDVAKHDVTAVEKGPDGRPLFNTPLIDLGETAPSRASTAWPPGTATSSSAQSTPACAGRCRSAEPSNGGFAFGHPPATLASGGRRARDRGRRGAGDRDGRGAAGERGCAHLCHAGDHRRAGRHAAVHQLRRGGGPRSRLRRRALLEPARRQRPVGARGGSGPLPPGAYGFHCSLHSWMVGKLVVNQSGGGPAVPAPPGGGGAEARVLRIPRRSSRRRRRSRSATERGRRTVTT